MAKINCTVCGKEVNKKREMQKRHVNSYCSKACQTKQRGIEREALGLCPRCGRLPAVIGRTYCSGCSQYFSERMKAKKRQVFEHYGRSCECCGESVLEFLTIDHIEGNGAKHRRAIKRYIYDWLVQNSFPEGFQTLCFNCNCAKGLSGQCPHQSQKSEVKIYGASIS